MIFLLTYDRRHGSLLSNAQYEESDIEKANADRLEAELAHSRDPNIEIVILRSASLDELENTHARYFRTLAELQKFS